MNAARKYRIGSPPWPCRNRMESDATDRATRLPPAESERPLRTRGTVRSAHACLSPAVIEPSPFVSMFGVSWNVGISAMSRT